MIPVSPAKGKNAAVPLFVRPFLASLIGMGLLLAGLHTPALAASEEPITLTIENQTAAPLRCVAVLAHFVTRDLPEAAPNQALTVTLERNLSQGTLAYDKHGSIPMMLENILCGDAARWDDTRADLPLLALRSDPAPRFIMTCRNGEGLTCRLRAP